MIRLQNTMWPEVRICWLASFLFVSFAAWPSQADEKIRREADKARAVKLLEADHKGEIEARWIAFNAASGRLLITNKTEEPLKVLVPVDMVAEHVVPADSAAGRAQTLGIGPHAQKGYQQNGFFNEGPGEAFFFVPAGKSAKADLPSVCLEYGRPDPSRRMRYQLRSVVAFTNPAPIVGFLKAWHTDRFSQNVAQATAWRLADGLTWERLAALRAGTVGAYTAGRPMFSRQDLDAAKKIAEEVTEAADKKAAK